VNILVIIIGSFFLLIISFQIYTIINSKRSAGKSIPFEKLKSGLSEKLKDKKALIYFHSPSCHNCKTLTPIIEELKTELRNIESIDISKDINTARAFGIMGTPALIFVNNNIVESVHLGLKSEKFIHTKLLGK